MRNRDKNFIKRYRPPGRRIPHPKKQILTEPATAGKKSFTTAHGLTQLVSRALIDKNAGGINKINR